MKYALGILVVGLLILGGCQATLPPKKLVKSQF